MASTFGERRRRCSQGRGGNLYQWFLSPIFVLQTHQYHRAEHHRRLSLPLPSPPPRRTGTPLQPVWSIESSPLRFTIERALPSHYCTVCYRLRSCDDPRSRKKQGIRSLAAKQRSPYARLTCQAASSIKVHPLACPLIRTSRINRLFPSPYLPFTAAHLLLLLMSVDIRQALTSLRFPSRVESVSRSQLSRVHTGDSTRPAETK